MRTRNHGLAALSLLGITVWLWRTKRARWVWIVTGVPTVWMYIVSTWALVSMTWPSFRNAEGMVLPRDPVPWAGAVLVALAALMLFEAVLVLVRTGPSTRPPAKLEPALASG